MGELPLHGAARLRGGAGCYWGSPRCAGLFDGGGKEAASGGAPAARGCSMEGERRLLLGELPLHGAVRYGGGEEAAIGGAPAARGCSMEGERRLLLGELPLRGAVRWRGGGGCVWGSSRCAGLFDGGGKEAASGGAPAARGCLMEGERRLRLGELPLRGAVRWRGGGGCYWGSSRCAGLFDRGGEEAASGGAPAARGCSMEGERRLLLGELPLRGAVRWRGKGGCFWGSSRCAGLFDIWRGGGGCYWGSSRCAGLFDRGGEQEAASGGAPAARGCSIEGGRRLLLGELPLRGAVR